MKVSDALRSSLWNYWGLHVEETDEGLKIKDDSSRVVSLIIAAPYALANRFGDAGAADFLAGVWMGRFAEPILHGGITNITVLP